MAKPRSEEPEVPPTTVGGSPEDDGTPASTSGDEVVVEGGSDFTPPADADTIIDPGGSPSDEALAGYDPSIESLDPTTAVAGADATVTVTGTNFTSDSVVESDKAAVPTEYVSETELTATLNAATASTVTVTVRNPAAAQESNSVDFEFTAAAGRRNR
jgi:hypothetical protein